MSDSETRNILLGSLDIRRTARPFFHEVYLDGNRLGRVIQSPYNSLTWIAEGISMRFYSKIDASMALVNEWIGSEP